MNGMAEKSSVDFAWSGEKRYLKSNDQLRTESGKPLQVSQINVFDGAECRRREQRSFLIQKEKRSELAADQLMSALLWPIGDDQIKHAKANPEKTKAMPYCFQTPGWEVGDLPVAIDGVPCIVVENRKGSRKYFFAPSLGYCLLRAEFDEPSARMKRFVIEYKDIKEVARGFYLPTAITILDDRCDEQGKPTGRLTLRLVARDIQINNVPDSVFVLKPKTGDRVVDNIKGTVYTFADPEDNKLEPPASAAEASTFWLTFLTGITIGLATIFVLIWWLRKKPREAGALVIALGLGMSQWCAAAEPPAQKDPVGASANRATVFFHDFRNGPGGQNRSASTACMVGLAAPRFSLGPLLAACAVTMKRPGLPYELIQDAQTRGPLRFEAEGLRLRIPRTVAPRRGTGVGFQTRDGLRGDFEITVSFDSFRADPPKAGLGVGLGLALYSPSAGTVQVGRVLQRNDERGVRWVWWPNESVRGRGTVQGMLPSEDDKGRLRLMRTGSTLFFLWAPGLQGDNFQEISQCAFGASDIEWARVNVFTGGVAGDVDARILDLRILGQMESEPAFDETKVPPPVAVLDSSKGRLAWSLAIGLILTLACLMAWLLGKRRRVLGKEANHG